MCLPKGTFLNPFISSSRSSCSDDAPLYIIFTTCSCWYNISSTRKSCNQPNYQKITCWLIWKGSLAILWWSERKSNVPGLELSRSTRCLIRTRFWQVLADKDDEDTVDREVNIFSAPLWLAKKRISRTPGSLLLWRRRQQGHVSTFIGKDCQSVD